MNFGTKWKAWIRGCLESARASIIINGSPTKEFSMSKEVRQGDPLSPFLFIIAMEGLSVTLKSTTSKGIFHGIHILNSDFSLSISYMQMMPYSWESGRRGILQT